MPLAKLLAEFERQSGNKIIDYRKEFGQPEKTIPRVPGHYRDWVDACKAGKESGADFEWAGPLAEAVLLGNVPLRVQLREKLTRYRLLWDSANLRFPNLAEAGKYLRRDYREGWTL